MWITTRLNKHRERLITKLSSLGIRSGNRDTRITLITGHQIACPPHHIRTRSEKVPTNDATHCAPMCINYKSQYACTHTQQNITYYNTQNNLRTLTRWNANLFRWMEACACARLVSTARGVAVCSCLCAHLWHRGGAVRACALCVYTWIAQFSRARAHENSNSSACAPASC